MNCEEFRELISARLDGELSPEEARDLEAHLEQCGDCAAFLQELEHLQALAQESPSASMPSDVQRAILRQTSQRATWLRRIFTGHYRIPRPVVWAAAAALLVLAADVVRSPRGTEPSGPGQTTATQAVQKIVLTESDVVRTYTTQSNSGDL